MDKGVVEPVGQQEQRPGQEPHPPETDHLLQFRIDAAEHVVVLGTDEKLEVVGGGAIGDRHAGVRGGGCVDGRGDVVGEGGLPHGDVGRRQKDRREVLVGHPGEGVIRRWKRSARSWPRWARFVELVIWHVEIQRVAVGGGVAEAEVAETAAPLDHVRDGRAIDRHFG